MSKGKWKPKPPRHKDGFLCTEAVCAGCKRWRPLENVSGNAARVCCYCLDTGRIRPKVTGGACPVKDTSPRDYRPTAVPVAGRRRTRDRAAERELEDRILADAEIRGQRLG